MNTIKKLQDIHIEPLKISYIGFKNVFSQKNKSDLIKILNKHQVFDNQLFKEGVPSISTEKAVLLLQVHNKKLNMSHLDEISATVLTKKVNQLARNLLLNTDTKLFGNSELIDPLSDAFSLPIVFSLKFIHSFENALLSSAKVGSSASGMALALDAIQDYQKATTNKDDLTIKFALLQGLYGTLQSILGIKSLGLTITNLVDSTAITISALAYTGAISAILTVAYLNIRSAFNLHRHHKIIKPVIELLKDKSTSGTEKNDKIAQYLQDQVSITPTDIENTYKHALESCQKNKDQSLDPKAEKYLFMTDLWFDENSHKLLNDSEEDPLSMLELLENPFKISLANELARIHESKINIFEKYMGSKALKHVQSNTLSNTKLVETVLKDTKVFRRKQYIVIALSLLAAVSLAAATISTGGVAIAASAIFIAILSLVAFSDIESLLSKLKDHMLTEKEKLGMALHIASSLLILAATVSIGVTMGASVPILVSATVIAILPVLLYAYILWEANRQLEKQASESTHKILSNSL